MRFLSREPQPTIRRGRTRIGEMFVELGLATREDVRRALERQRTTGRRLGETLYESGVISSLDLARVLAAREGIEFVDLSTVEPEPAAIALVPVEVARRYGVVPIALEDERLCVAAVNPNDVYALDDLRALTGRDLRVAMADPAQIVAALDALDPPLGADATTIARDVAAPEDRAPAGPAGERSHGSSAPSKAHAAVVTSEIRRLDATAAAIRGAAHEATMTVGDELLRYLSFFTATAASATPPPEAVEMCFDLHLLALRNLAVFVSDPRLERGAAAFVSPWPPRNDDARDAVARLAVHERWIGRHLAGPATDSPLRTVPTERLDAMRADLDLALESFFSGLPDEHRAWFEGARI